MILRKGEAWSWLLMLILYLHPANERWRYNVTSLIGWPHIQNDPYINHGIDYAGQMGPCLSQGRIELVLYTDLGSQGYFGI